MALKLAKKPHFGPKFGKNEQDALNRYFEQMREPTGYRIGYQGTKSGVLYWYMIGEKKVVETIHRVRGSKRYGKKRACAAKKLVNAVENIIQNLRRQT